MSHVQSPISKPTPLIAVPPTPTDFYAVPLGKNEMVVYWKDTSVPNVNDLGAGTEPSTTKRAEYRFNFYELGIGLQEKEIKQIIISGTTIGVGGNPIQEYAPGQFMAILRTPSYITGLNAGITYKVKMTSVNTGFELVNNKKTTVRRSSNTVETYTVNWGTPTPVTNVQVITYTNNFTVSWKEPLGIVEDTLPGLTGLKYRVGLSVNGGPYTVYDTFDGYNDQTHTYNNSVTIPKSGRNYYDVRITALYVPQFNSGDLADLFSRFYRYVPNDITPAKDYIISSKVNTPTLYNATNPNPPTITGAVVKAYTGGGTKASVYVQWNAPTFIGNSEISRYILEYGITNSPSSWSVVPSTFSAFSPITNATVSLPRVTSGYSFRMKAVNRRGEVSSYSTSFYLPTP